MWHDYYQDTKYADFEHNEERLYKAGYEKGYQARNEEIDYLKKENTKLEEENSRLREALEFIKSTMDEEKINLEMMRQVEYWARHTLKRSEELGF